jgi:hypothetical protein
VIPINDVSVATGRIKNGQQAILAAHDSDAAQRTHAAILEGQRILGFRRPRPAHVATIYLPYFYGSWNVTIPKPFGTRLRLRLCSGTNGITRTTGMANEIPPSDRVLVHAGAVMAPTFSVEDARRRLYETVRRYVEGQELYLRSCTPADRATLVIDNDDLSAPRIVSRRPANHLGS